VRFFCRKFVTSCHRILTACFQSAILPNLGQLETLPGANSKCCILGMTERDRVKLRDEITKAFEDGSVFGANEQTLLSYLRSLCSEDVPNERVRHRELLRGITIHFIQTTKLIALLEARNKKTQFWFMVLAIGSIIVGVIGLFLGG